VAIARLAHYSVRTRDLEASRCFYTEVLGLKVGPRPPFPFPGLWLYPDKGESELGAVHLIGIDASNAHALETHLGPRREQPDRGTGALDHIAFLATDWRSLRERCEHRSVPYAERTIPELGLLQVFLTDPSGVTIELNYAASEARSVPAE